MARLVRRPNGSIAYVDDEVLGEVRGDAGAFRAAMLGAKDDARATRVTSNTSPTGSVNGSVNGAEGAGAGRAAHGTRSSEA